MKILSVFAASSCIATLLGAQPDPAANEPPIAADAVWQPPPDFLSRFHSACDTLGGAGFTDCFLSEMRKANAPPPALAFARRTEGMGYLRAFRETGAVDVAYAEYPFRANENQVCLLVNGSPPWIDVDDLSRLDRKGLDGDRTWIAIRRTYPKATLFPSDRGDPALPLVAPFGNGGIEFVVAYRALDGCHACAIVGTVRFAFRFDAAGKFLGTALEGVARRS